MNALRIALLTPIFCLATACNAASTGKTCAHHPSVTSADEQAVTPVDTHAETVGADDMPAQQTDSSRSALRTGAERLESLLPHLSGKRVGLIVNQTSIVGPQQTHLLDTLVARGVDVRRIFAPEHGFRGDADAGEKVTDGRDPRTGLPITSLYGKTRKPTAEMLSGIDVVVFDIQDVGARFYTYISTMLYAMEAAAEQGKAFVVLDRPNPNDTVDGPLLDPAYKSFVGALPIPLLHGLTVGELARMIVGEGWIASSEKLTLTVIPMSGWRHGEPYSLPVKPSPNLPNDVAIRLYPSLCLFEATKVSVGRGTTMPFQVVGYPDARFGAFTFTPTALAGSDKNPLQKDCRCYGLDLRADTTTHGFDLTIFKTFLDKAPERSAFITSTSFFDRLAGCSTLRQQLLRGDSIEQIRQSWQSELATYRTKRARYLIYEE